MVSSLSFATEAVNNPTRYYQRPRQVIQDRRLNRNEKLAILDAWELEARSLSVASEENMGGGEPTLLSEVVEARISLGEHADPTQDNGAPTKQWRAQDFVTRFENAWSRFDAGATVLLYERSPGGVARSGFRNDSSGMRTCQRDGAGASPSRARWCRALSSSVRKWPASSLTILADGRCSLDGALQGAAPLRRHERVLATHHEHAVGRDTGEVVNRVEAGHRPRVVRELQALLDRPPLDDARRWALPHHHVGAIGRRDSAQARTDAVGKIGRGKAADAQPDQQDSVRGNALALQQRLRVLDETADGLHAHLRIGADQRAGHLVGGEEVQRREAGLPGHAERRIPGQEIDHARLRIAVDAPETQRPVVGGDTAAKQDEVEQIEHGRSHIVGKPASMTGKWGRSLQI